MCRLLYASFEESDEKNVYFIYIILYDYCRHHWTSHMKLLYILYYWGWLLLVLYCYTFYFFSLLSEKNKAKKKKLYYCIIHTYTEHKEHSLTYAKYISIKMKTFASCYYSQFKSFFLLKFLDHFFFIFYIIIYFCNIIFIQYFIIDLIKIEKNYIYLLEAVA